MQTRGLECPTGKQLTTFPLWPNGSQFQMHRTLSCAVTATIKSINFSEFQTAQSKRTRMKDLTRYQAQVNWQGIRCILVKATEYQASYYMHGTIMQKFDHNF